MVWVQPGAGMEQGAWAIIGTILGVYCTEMGSPSTPHASHSGTPYSTIPGTRLSTPKRAAARPDSTSSPSRFQVRQTRQSGRLRFNLPCRTATYIIHYAASCMSAEMRFRSGGTCRCELQCEAGGKPAGEEAIQDMATGGRCDGKGRTRMQRKPMTPVPV
jgi:hypothetical protein